MTTDEAGLHAYIEVMRALLAHAGSDPGTPPGAQVRSPGLAHLTAYLEDHPAPTAAEAREAISGNLCRCTGYQNIVAAVLRAAEIKRGEGA